MNDTYEIALIGSGLLLMIELILIGQIILGAIYPDPVTTDCTTTFITVTGKTPDYQWINGDRADGYYYYINEPGMIVYDEILPGVTYDISYCIYKGGNYIKTIQRQSCVIDDTGTCR